MGECRWEGVHLLTFNQKKKGRSLLLFFGGEVFGWILFRVCGVLWVVGCGLVVGVW